MPLLKSLTPALIFDLDGTLADTSPDLLGATNAVLAARGRPRLDLDHLRHMVGFGAVALITQAMEPRRTKGRTANCSNTKPNTPRVRIAAKT